MPEREELEGGEESELRLCRQELREITRMAAHDLHTALRTISIHTALLNEVDGAKLDPEIKQRVSYVVEAANQLRALADGLASYSASIEGDREISPAVALETILRLALARLAALIRQKNATITNGPLPKIPGNIDLLTRLFENLISNALRYHGPQVPVIHVYAEKRDQSWVLGVRDNGDGIDPMYRVSIFDPFKRLHGKDRSGAGLGLTVCRRIVALHNGSIWVEPNPEGGSIFFVALPATAAQDS